MEHNPRPGGLGATGMSSTNDPDLSTQAGTEPSTKEQVQEKAQEVGAKAQEQAEKGKEQTAGGMERAAEVIREKTGDGSGMPAQAGAKAAEALDNTSGYLRSHSTQDLWKDVESYAKRHPAQALASSVIAGLLLGRLLR